MGIIEVSDDSKLLAAPSIGLRLSLLIRELTQHLIFSVSTSLLVCVLFYVSNSLSNIWEQEPLLNFSHSFQI